MEKINKELIEKLKRGEITLCFGVRSRDEKSLQQLNEVLNLATGQQSRFFGIYNYYYLTTKGDVNWTDNPRLGKEIVELEQFFITKEKQAPKQGDTVWVRNNKNSNWLEKVFISFIDLENCPYKIAAINSEMLGMTMWKQYTFENPYKSEIEVKIKILEEELEVLKKQLRKCKE